MKGISVKQTACHEAVHAVMSYCLHRRIKYVTIIPGVNCLGHIHHGEGPDIASCEWEMTPRTRTVLERDAMVACGGNVAECLLTGRKITSGSGADTDQAIDLLSYNSGGDPDEMGAYVDWLWYRTRSTLKLPSHWAAVKGLAMELLSKKTIGGGQARQIIGDAIQAYLRDEKTSMEKREPLTGRVRSPSRLNRS